MVSLSYSATLDVIDRTTANHDSLPIDWRNSLLHYLSVTADLYYSNVCFKVSVGTSR